jgi:hypothetical protein
MSSRIVDADGVVYIRDRDGSMVPDLPPVEDLVPSHPEGTRCAEHWRTYGTAAAHCYVCWSEAKAGNRPRAFVGRVYPDGGA